MLDKNTQSHSHDMGTIITLDKAMHQDSKSAIDETKLAEMLCTRLCHDLTGPIGAVNNGVEFLEDEGFDMHNEALQLILNSAEEAVNRLQFYRQAYGRVSESGEVCLADKKALADAFFAPTKITLDWPDTHTDASGVSFNQKMGRLIMNLLIICAQSLIRGGTISVRLEETDSGAKTVTITGKGQSLKMDEEIKSVLSGDHSHKLSPKLSQPYLTTQILQEIGAQMKISIAEEELTLFVEQQSVAAIHTDVTTG